MKKKRVGIITFHAAHNYGSMLQAYALQQTISNMDFLCEIINFRTQRQKDMYCLDFERGSVYERVKRFFIQLPYVSGLLDKHRLFEDFLQKELVLSEKEYSTLQKLEKANFSYDYYISGSDQIWNDICIDFDWAYFLPFVKSGSRIAYAPSMGPKPENFRKENTKQLEELLSNYDAISAREPRTAQYIERITSKRVPALIDPTLLLPIETWEELAGKQPLIAGKYIFLYSPWYNEKLYQMAAVLSEQYQMKVVVSQAMPYLSSAIKWRKFNVYPAVGPKEFLNLCKNAQMVCCNSFHAVVFSVLFRVPFATLNGMKDSRVDNLLFLMGMKENEIPVTLDSDIFQEHFVKAHEAIAVERQKALTWLEKHLSGNFAF